MSKDRMDKQFKETREELDKLMIIIKQEEKGSWRYEWPTKKKVRWPIEDLISRK